MYVIKKVQSSLTGYRVITLSCRPNAEFSTTSQNGKPGLFTVYSLTKQDGNYCFARVRLDIMTDDNHRHIGIMDQPGGGLALWRDLGNYK